MNDIIGDCRRGLAIVIALFLAVFVVSAQSSVSGKVVDPMDGSSMPGVDCRVYSLADTSKVVAQTASDDNGDFRVALPSGGNYRLHFRAIGFADKSVPFVVSAAHPDARLGVIAMDNSGIDLGEVEVTAHVPVIQSNGEKVTYNMQEDPQSKTSNILEMLRKVPLVAVDGQDNITVNGQSNFKIYINGKENPMMSRSAKDILKAMPASSIKKIEVITEPGAKYDAEGAGGILNLVTEGASGSAIENGYMMNLSANASYSRGGAGIYALGQIGKVTASVNYNYNRNYDPRSRDIEIDRKFSTPVGDNRMLMAGKQKDANNFHSGSMELSWDVDSLNLFTLGAEIFYGDGSNELPMTTSRTGADGSKLWSYRQQQTSLWNWGSVSASASYQHTFGRMGHNLIFTYRFNRDISRTKSYIHYYDLDKYFVPYAYQRGLNDNPGNEHTLQLDYVNPLSEHHTIETGAKAIIRRNQSDGVTRYSADGSSWIEDHSESASSSLAQDQDVLAAYGSYSGVFGKWSVKGGLRYEYTRLGVDFIKGKYIDFSTTLNDLVPNAAIAYTIKPTSTLRLSYQMRISRPGVSQLNPYRDESNPVAVSYGNPDLSSERSNVLTLTYSNFMDVVGMNLTASYRRTDNNISQYSYTANDKVYTTYDNAGRSQMFSFNAYLNFTITNKIRLNVYGSTNFVDYHFDKIGLSNSGWGCNLGGNFTYEMPRNFRLALNGGYGQQAPRIQSDGMSYYYYNISLMKSFFKDRRLEVSLSISNPFNDMKISMNQWTADSHTRFNVIVPSRNIGLSVSYRIGGLNKRVKKTAVQVVNDDVERSSSGGSSIGGSIGN